MDTKIQVLEMYSTSGVSQAKQIWPDCELTNWEFCNPTGLEMAGQYDAVLSNNVLQLSSYRIAGALVKQWANCLKDGGELHLFAPSLEWCAREVLSEKSHPLTYAVLFGGQGGDGIIHMGGYTMRLLRALFEQAGLSVKIAKTAEFEVSMDGKVYKPEQHYLLGVRGTPALSKE
jgi:hypothetical protein